MKKKYVIISIIAGLLIVVGILWLIVFRIEDDSLKEESFKESNADTVENYQELGSERLEEDKIFDEIKYTRNHLSTTDDSYATFTSVIFNETDHDILHQDITIIFLNQVGDSLGEMESVIENVKVGESTVIYGIIEKNMTDAYDFRVEMEKDNP